MISIDVQFDARELRLQLDRLHDSAVDAAMARALNRTATSVRAQVSREIRTALPVSARALKKRLTIRRANRADLVATIKAGRDYDPALGNFSPRWKQKQAGGATVKLKGAGRLTVLGSFTAPTKWGGVGVYKRLTARRYPIKFLRASDAGLPTLRAAFLQAAADSGIQRLAVERFRTEYERELRFRATQGGSNG